MNVKYAMRWTVSNLLGVFLSPNENSLNEFWLNPSRLIVFKLAEEVFFLAKFTHLNLSLSVVIEEKVLVLSVLLYEDLKLWVSH